MGKERFDYENKPGESYPSMDNSQTIRRNRKKINAVKIAIIVFVFTNGLILFNLFCGELTLFFMKAIGFLSVPILYISSIVCALFAKGKQRIKALIINFSTPIVVGLMMFTSLPIYLNFIVLYPIRSDIVHTVPEGKYSKCYQDSPPTHYEELVIEDWEDGRYAYFKMREETLYGSCEDILPAESGFEYREVGFADEMKHYNRCIYFGNHWRYMYYERTIVF